MTSAEKPNRLTVAWDLVDRFVEDRLNVIAEQNKQAFLRAQWAALDRAAISPLGAFLWFERVRNGWALSDLSLFIASSLRNHPDLMQKPVKSTSLFRLEDNPQQRAQPGTLAQLHAAFGVSMDWLRIVNQQVDTNMESATPSSAVSEIATVLTNRPETIAIVEALLRLTPEKFMAASHFIEGLQGEALSAQRRQKSSEDSGKVVPFVQPGSRN